MRKEVEEHAPGSPGATGEAAAPAGGASGAVPTLKPVEESPVEEPAGTAAEEEETPPGKAGVKAPVRPPKPRVDPNAEKQKAMARAALYEREGRKALLIGDLGQAERKLQLCLRTAEYAACHRQLGVLYASKEDTKAAIMHYERYIELEPNAPDAARVRQLIQDAKHK